MRPRSGDDKKSSPLFHEQGDEELDAIEESVRRAFVTTTVHQDRLERLLVTMLAAVVHNPDEQISSEERAADLADLLIRSVREAHRLSRSN